MSQPQITEIARSFAAKLPKEGAEAETVEAWRAALRYARRTGTIGQLSKAIAQDIGGDAELAAHLRSLNS